MTHKSLCQESHPKWGNESICVHNLVILPAADASPIVGGSLVLQDGLIADLGPSETIRKRHPQCLQIDGKGFLALPGLFNAHTHASMSFFRGRGHSYKKPEKNATSTTMIENFFFPVEQSLTPDLTGPLAYSYLVDGLKSGVTSFVDAYFFMDGVAAAMEKIGVRGFIGEHIADLGGPHPAGNDLWLKVKRKIEAWPWSHRVKPVVYAHATDTVSIPLLKELGQYAKKADLPFHMHLSQSDGERERVAARAHMTPVAYAQRCGVLYEKSLVVHLVSVDDEDIVILKNQGVTMGYCPASEIIYERLPPIAKLAAAGIPMALGTDCAASCDGADIMAELRLAGILGKQANWTDDVLSPQSLLAMVSHNPARVLGETQLGHLRKGAKADCVFMAIDLGVEPLHAIPTNIIYSFNSRHVQHVMVDGQWVLWRQNLVKVSEEDLKQDYDDALKRIRFSDL